MPICKGYKDNCEATISWARYNRSGLCGNCFDRKYYDKHRERLRKEARERYHGIYKPKNKKKKVEMVKCVGYSGKPCPHKALVTKRSKYRQCGKCRNKQWFIDHPDYRRMKIVRYSRIAIEKVFTPHSLQHKSTDKFKQAIIDILEGTKGFTGLGK